MQLKPGSTAWLLSKGHRRCPGVLLCFQCSVFYSLRFVWTFNHKLRCLSVVWQRGNLQRKIHFITYDLYPPEEQQSEIPMKISCWEVGELHSGVLCSLYTSLQYFLNSDFSDLPSCVFRTVLTSSSCVLKVNGALWAILSLKTNSPQCSSVSCSCCEVSYFYCLSLQLFHYLEPCCIWGYWFRLNRIFI